MKGRVLCCCPLGVAQGLQTADAVQARVRLLPGVSYLCVTQGCQMLVW